MAEKLSESAGFCFSLGELLLYEVCPSMAASVAVMTW